MKPIITTLLALILIVQSGYAQVTLVQDIVKGSPSSYPASKTNFNKYLVFIDQRQTLWAYDDKVLACTKVAATAHPGSSIPIINNKLYFSQSKTATTSGLYTWDGINAPVRVQDNVMDIQGGEPDNMIALNNKLYFIAASVPHPGTTQAHLELWMHDPATNITKRIYDTIGTYYPVAFNNKIYFTARGISGPSRSDLYMYDPVTDTAFVDTNIKVSLYGKPTHLNVCYNKLFYSDWNNTYGRELYMYDGVNPSQRITDINPGWPSSNVSTVERGLTSSVIGYKGYVYFVAKDGLPGHRLYKYDTGAKPSDLNPVLVHNISTKEYPSTENSLFEFIEFDGKLFFTGSDSTHGFELWMYDGINAPSMIADIDSGKGDSYPKHFAVYNDSLYFTANGKDVGDELYMLGVRAGSGSVYIANVSKVNSVKVYPVPAQNILNIEVDLNGEQAFTVRLYDVAGKEVYSSGAQTAHMVQADISGLASGNYYYRIAGTDGIMLGSGQVIKE